jgi:hypothetical protein
LPESSLFHLSCQILYLLWSIGLYLDYFFRCWIHILVICPYFTWHHSMKIKWHMIWQAGLALRQFTENGIRSALMTRVHSARF